MADRVLWYAWEAAHFEPGMQPVVHAVAVLDQGSPGVQGAGVYSFGVEVGQRNTLTKCGRKVGQRADQVRWRGISRCRQHLQLHLAADLVGLERCRGCQAVLESRFYARVGTSFAEWRDPLPVHPAPHRLDGGPCAAPYPDYYRWRTEGGGYWLPGEEWLDEVHPPGLEWHEPQRFLNEDRLAKLNRQRDVNERRVAERRMRLEALAARDEVAVAMEEAGIRLLEEVAGTAALDQLVTDGYVDVPSPSRPDRGYRLRPWSRTGMLVRRDGGWMELPRSYCAHPDELYPAGDELAGLWLSLRYDEAGFLVVANVHEEAAA